MKREHLVKVERHYFSGMNKPIMVTSGMTIDGSKPWEIEELIQSQGIKHEHKIKTLYVKPENVNKLSTFIGGLSCES